MCEHPCAGVRTHTHTHTHTHEVGVVGRRVTAPVKLDKEYDRSDAV